MRKGIVLKLFILTTALCMLILATIFIGQTVFFKQYYANRKVKDIETNMAAYEKSYLSNSNVEAIQKLEQDFYRENNTWITMLDRYGNLKHADDFYIEVKLERLVQKEIGQETIRIPLYNLVSFDEIEENVQGTQMTGMKVYFSGMKKDSTFIPSILNMKNGNTDWINKVLDKKLSDIVLQIKKKEKTAEEVPYIFFTGIVTKFQIPDKSERVDPIYKNNVFMDSIKEFQSDLLLNESKNIRDTLQTIDYEKMI